MSWECPSCGFKNNDESILRCSCGYELTISEAPNYNKIGGALILITIGLIVNPFLGISALLQIFQIINSEFWPSSGPFGNSIKPLIIFEVIWSVIHTIGPIFLLILMLKRKKIFPKLSVTFLLLMLALSFIELFWIKAIQNVPNKSELLYRARFGTLLNFLTCLIWVPYFFISERVRETFIR